MNNIMDTLKSKGIEVIKTDNFFIGYKKTEKGVICSRNPKSAENGVYFLKLSIGKFPIPCNSDVCYVTFGTEYEGKIKTKNEAAQLAREGKIYSFVASDLYAEYYNFAEDKELESYFKYRYSTRTRKYIERVMDNIGMIRYTDACNGSSDPNGVPSEFEELESYRNTSIGRLDNGEWIAQTCTQIEIDDFAVMKLYFSKKPSAKDIHTAEMIVEFEKDMFMGFVTEVFECWECHKLTNWLDCPGDFKEKISKLHDKYCGC